MIIFKILFADKKSSWLTNAIATLEKTPKTKNPTVLNCQFYSEKDAFEAICRPILNKPKPYCATSNQLRKLSSLLCDDKVKNDAVFSWIQENVPKEKINSTAFIDILTRFVAVSQIYEGQLSNGFESRINILIHYINPPNLDMEIAALNALQRLMDKLKHPKSESIDFTKFLKIN